MLSGPDQYHLFGKKLLGCGVSGNLMIFAHGWIAPVSEKPAAD